MRGTGAGCAKFHEDWRNDLNGLNRDPVKGRTARGRGGGIEHQKFEAQGTQRCFVGPPWPPTIAITAVSSARFAHGRHRCFMGMSYITAKALSQMSRA